MEQIISKKAMMQGLKKKKACDVEFEKQNYLQHLNRLVRIKGGKSVQQIRKTEQQKKLALTINKMRKYHQQSRQFRILQLKQQQKQSKQTDFSKIKPVIRNTFQTSIRPLRIQQRQTDTSLIQQNNRIYERLAKVKPCININTNTEHLNSIYNLKIKLRQNIKTQSIDFSYIYDNSELKEKRKIVKISLGRKKYVKGVLNFQIRNLRGYIQDVNGVNCVYVLEIQCGKYKERTPFIHLNLQQQWQIKIRVSEKVYESNNVTAKLIKIVEETDNRETIKAEFILKPSSNIKQARNRIHFTLQLSDKLSKAPFFRDIKAQTQHAKPQHPHPHILRS